MNLTEKQKETVLKARVLINTLVSMGHDYKAIKDYLEDGEALSKDFSDEDQDLIDYAHSICLGYIAFKK